jgi:hypothetical protein
MMAGVPKPPVGCMVVSMFALDIEQVSVVVSAWEELGREVLVPLVNESQSQIFESGALWCTSLTAGTTGQKQR